MTKEAFEEARGISYDIGTMEKAGVPLMNELKVFKTSLPEGSETEKLVKEFEGKLADSIDIDCQNLLKRFAEL